MPQLKTISFFHAKIKIIDVRLTMPSKNFLSRRFCFDKDGWPYDCPGRPALGDPTYLIHVSVRQGPAFLTAGAEWIF